MSLIYLSYFSPKALLIFPKSDNCYDALKTACHRHQFETVLLKTGESVVDVLHRVTNTDECYHIIIIDVRSPKLIDAEHIAR